MSVQATDVFSDLLREAQASEDFQPLLEHLPYARLIGARCLREGDSLLLHLPPNRSTIGNPLLPAIHGGVIAGFMELAASLHLMAFMAAPRPPKIIDFSIDYLRTGQIRDTYAQCQVWRQGRRVANVAITAWQGERAEPIATARAHFKVDPA